jgi:hypothetical protein
MPRLVRPGQWPLRIPVVCIAPTAIPNLTQRLLSILTKSECFFRLRGN